MPFFECFDLLERVEIALTGVLELAVILVCISRGRA